MIPEPVLSIAPDQAAPINATGAIFAVREWRGSGPARLHVHNSDDEAWHVLSGMLRFRFADRSVDAPAGSTVFVPAGTAHTFAALTPDTRYLLFLPLRLVDLIDALHGAADAEDQRAIYRQYASEILE